MGRTSDASHRLKEAILDLMWEGSYGALTIDDICKRADVKKGSFYYFFESKADLAIAAVEWRWQNETKPLLDSLFSPSIEPVRRLIGALERLYERQCVHKCRCGKVLGCPFSSLGSEVTTNEGALGAKVRDVFSRKRRYYESAIRDGVADGSIPPCDPVYKAQALWGLVEGILSQARLMNDAEVLKNLPQMALELLQARQPVASSREPFFPPRRPPHARAVSFVLTLTR
jgi:TetR/AcrR family transcriptional repressor of nem operon